MPLKMVLWIVPAVQIPVLIAQSVATLVLVLIAELNRFMNVDQRLFSFGTSRLMITQMSTFLRVTVSRKETTREETLINFLENLET